MDPLVAHVPEATRKRQTAVCIPDTHWAPQTCENIVCQRPASANGEMMNECGFKLVTQLSDQTGEVEARDPIISLQINPL